MNALVVLSTLLCVAFAQTPLGSLSTLQHAVSGNVFAIDDRTLEIRDFNYDGTAPAAYFWVGTGEVSSAGTRALVASECEMTQLPEFTGGTVRVELPADMRLSSISYLSVWCESFAVDFGNVKFDSSDTASVPVATGPSACSKTGTFPVQEGWNCEQLSTMYQARWRRMNSLLDVELVAKIDPGRYMGFGVSGSATRTNMDKADVVITYMDGDKPSAVDYFLNGRSQCTSGTGVCPDTDNSAGIGTDNVSNISGSREGDTLRVSYTRPLIASDEATDKPVAVGEGERTYVVWAMGPITEGLPQYHQGEMVAPSGDVVFEFGRAAINNCATPIIAGAEKKEEETKVTPWTREVIHNVTDITARIGPSGGSQGVSGLTDAAAWGIAWWMSPTGTTGQETLIPAIAVERGETYTFRVFGGDNVKELGRFHPLYITSDKDGGFQTKSSQARAKEKIYAGVDGIVRPTNDSVTDFRATAAGPLCEFTNKRGVNPDTFASFEEYAKTVNKACIERIDATKAGVLTWTVPVDFEPSEVYYQCVTHRDLGFKIMVFDKGAVDLPALRRASGGGEPTCEVTFNGKTEGFQGCSNLGDDVEMFWNINGDTIDVLYSGVTEGWVGISLGYNEMVPSSSVIAYATDTDVAIDDYMMTSRSTSGVQPASKQMLSNMTAEKSNGKLVGRFTRPLAVDGVKTIDPSGEIDVLYAFGPKPTSGTTLQRHSTRKAVKINLLAKGGAASQAADNRRTIFVAHGILMGIAWVILVPSAVIAMRFFKRQNPATFQAHRALNSLAVLACVIAFIMAVVRGSHTNTRHLVIGVIITAFALSQAINGAARPHKGEGGRRPWFLLHAYSGRVALVLAIVNVYVGLDLFKSVFSEKTNVWRIVVGVVVGFFAAAAIGLSLFPNSFPVVEDNEQAAAAHDEN